jgi:hypothetical protein
MNKKPAALAFWRFDAYIPGHPRQQNVLLCGGSKGSPRGESFCFWSCADYLADVAIGADH